VNAFLLQGVLLGAGVCLVVGGFIALCFGVGAWGLWHARRRGLVCPDCGRWGSHADIRDHIEREHSP
jgi:hypothetical protein